MGLFSIPQLSRQTGIRRQNSRCGCLCSWIIITFHGKDCSLEVGAPVPSLSLVCLLEQLLGDLLFQGPPRGHSPASP